MRHFACIVTLQSLTQIARHTDVEAIGVTDTLQDMDVAQGPPPWLRHSGAAAFAFGPRSSRLRLAEP